MIRKIFLKREKSSLSDLFSNRSHKIHKKMDIMKRQKLGPQHFVGVKKMAKVSARKTPAGVASATFRQGIFILLVLCVSHHHESFGSKRRAGSAIPRGIHAIKKIGPEFNGLQKIKRRPNAHQVTRLFLGHSRKNGAKDGQRFCFFLSDAKAAKGITVKTNLDGAFQRLLAMRDVEVSRLMIIMISRDVFIFIFTMVLIMMAGVRKFPPSPYGKASTVLQVATIFAVLLCNWRGAPVPELQILYFTTGFITAFSGLHYLVTKVLVLK